MKLARNSVIKWLAAMLAVAALAACSISLLVVAQVSYSGGYSPSCDETKFTERMFTDQIYSDLSEVSDYYSLVLNGQSWTQDRVAAYANRFSASNSNFFFSVTDFDTEEVLLSNYTDSFRCFLQEDSYITPADYYNYYDTSVGYAYDETTTSYYDVYYDAEGNVISATEGTDSALNESSEAKLSLQHVMITGYVRSDLTGVNDIYTTTARGATLLYALRNTAVSTAAVSAVVFLVLFLFLMYASGRRAGSPSVALRFVDRIPWDVMLVLAGALGMLGAVLLSYYEPLLYQPFQTQLLLLAAITVVAFGTLFMIVSMSFAARGKVPGWWKNSLLYRLASWVGAALHHPLRGLGELLRQLPLAWKTMLAGCILVALECFCLVQLYWYGSVLPIVLFNILVALLILSGVVNMRKLQKAGKAIADGDLDYRVDLTHMHLDYRRHGEDLNRIGNGISAAVEERLKSERFKTELITNVSHDLKTPLTSIVNYVDLLSKLELPEDARTYVEVLQRQSARLKKLTVDLVDASKASTGNLTVEITQVDLNELVAQVCGEYEDRFQKLPLGTVIQLPEERIFALADGRYLWRVMDNLLSNVFKYALPDTRVYIDAELSEGNAIIAVKNISRERLNVSADELMKRFVRGDSSRTTEGSGLGLSIAQSLVELMGGKLVLTVDGDLFKAEVRLRPSMPPHLPQAPTEA